MESKIIGYRGIANKDRVIIFGHAFEKHKVKELDPLHGKRRNLRQTIGRFRSRPLKWTAIDIKVNGAVMRVRTDKDGFFQGEILHGLNGPGWYDYELVWKRNHKNFMGEFYLSDSHETGVISDIDDTLLVSHSTKWVRKLALMLFKNAYTRKTIPFIGHWNQHIKDLNDTAHPRDFFYVSNSEWNLYDFLEDFFRINELPKGVFFLQNYKNGLKDFMIGRKDHKNHKLRSIEFLMQFFPEKRFILVGDNGQKDMEIYSNIVAKYHQRIKGVLIRRLPYIHNDKVIHGYKVKINHFDVPFNIFG